MRRGNRRPILLLQAVLLVAALPARALEMTSLYSPRNAERPVRKATTLIILHTTEGPTKGSLDKVRRNGECHYLVAPDGHVYRIIERSRVAYHAGRSMWRGKTELDNYSVGIEMVGYHNRDLSASQYRALRELLDQLQKLYRIPDDSVLPHSMVAYGAPNRWHKRSHRGRKRCAMCLADPARRAKLGLTAQPHSDPDVKAGRLIVADPYLARVLYGNIRERQVALSHFDAPDANVISTGRSAWDVARDMYRSSETIYTFPDGTRKNGREIRDWSAIPVGTRVQLPGTQSGNVGDPEPAAVEIPAVGAQNVSPDAAGLTTTIYIFADGRVLRGDELPAGERGRLPEGTRVLTGYVHGGRITTGRSAFDICGPKWNKAETLYRLPDGTLVSGDRVRENNIPRNTHVFLKN